MTLDTQLILKSSLTLSFVSESELLVEEGAKNKTLFKGAVFSDLCKLLSKRMTREEIADQLSQRHSDAEAHYALLSFENRGFFRKGAGLEVPPHIAALLDSWEVPFDKALERLKSTPIGFLSFGSASAEEGKRFFADYPFIRSEQPRLQIVLTDHYRRSDLLSWSQKAEKEQIAWILVKESGLQGWAGPLFTPGQMPCYQCLLSSLQKNQYEERLSEKTLGLEEPPITPLVSIPSIRQPIFSRLALEAFRWIVTQEASSLSETLFTCDSSGTFTEHRLIPSYQCACFKEKDAKATNNRWEFSSQPIVSFDGGFRSVSPEETWEKYKHLVSPITGLVHSVFPAPTETSSLIFGASYHRAARLDSQTFLKEEYREKSAGKGKTAAQAKTGALCEALERISGQFRESDPRIQSTYEKLGKDAIHPSALLHFSEQQYQKRNETNPHAGKFNRVPRPFEPNEETDWTAVWSLTEKKNKWVPTAYAYRRSAIVQGKEPFCIGDTNGSAAGNTIEEALFQGLLEVVERDSAALWWYPKIACPEVDLRSFQDPFFEKTMQFYRENKRELWVLDLTFDLPIPVFVAVMRWEDELGVQMLYGFGCHLIAKIAIARAITEVDQSRQSELGQKRSPEVQLIPASLFQEPYLFPNGKRKTKSDYLDPSFVDLKDALEYLIRCVGSQGLEVLVLNQTRSEIGLPVVKAIVPGLRHFWARFAPGRLYDVPVKMRRVSKAVPEKDLNEVPIRV